VNRAILHQETLPRVYNLSVVDCEFVSFRNKILSGLFPPAADFLLTSTVLRRKRERPDNKDKIFKSKCYLLHAKMQFSTLYPELLAPLGHMGLIMEPVIY
jgi:hypothetical protein